MAFAHLPSLRGKIVACLASVITSLTWLLRETLSARRAERIVDVFEREAESVYFTNLIHTLKYAESLDTNANIVLKMEPCMWLLLVLLATAWL